ncbi:MAG: hypothetical protein RL021_190 [Bacteroidota bacterium]|jgi:hypothetical protein
MNAAHLHLLVNHAGIFGLLFSTLILIAGMLFKIPVLNRTAMVGFLIAAVSVAVSMNSGEGAEEFLERVVPLNEPVVESHEDSAELSAWLAGASGLISVFGLFLYWRKRPVPSFLFTVLLIVALVATGSIVNTGRLGGKIRHTELSGTSVLPDVQGAEEEDDD